MTPAPFSKIERLGDWENDTIHEWRIFRQQYWDIAGHRGIYNTIVELTYVSVPEYGRKMGKEGISPPAR